MKILLTGGTGLIGRHLIARLQALHHDITVVTRSPESASGAGAGVDIWKIWPSSKIWTVSTPLLTSRVNPSPISAGRKSKNSCYAAAGGTSPKSWSS
jgi:NAD(P)-dependent dehydrogenase (short-subunit alcohol dehydrogenase family)